MLVQIILDAIIVGIVKKLEHKNVDVYVEEHQEDVIKQNVDVHQDVYIIVQIIAMMVIKVGHYALTMHRTSLFLLT